MSVPVRDLRNNSAALLKRVQQGEHVVVTKDGEPVAEATFEPLPFDAAAARAFGAVAASLRASGRKPAARGYDALIAAVGPLSAGEPR